MNIKAKKHTRKKCLISPEIVEWAYRILLGREPENKEVVLDKALRLKNTQELLSEFVNSEEYKSKNAGLPAPTMLGNEPAMHIESVQANKDLQILFRHIQDAWQHMGEIEPHWSVLTAEKYKKANLLNSDEFYSTGKENVSVFLKTLDRNGVDHSSFKTCLEIGCGLGRVTLWLSARFDTVYGYDISEAHLKSANEYLSGKGINNVELRHIARLNDVMNLPKVDMVYSVIVLQHNPPPIISVFIREIIRALSQGGVAFFQVPVYGLNYRFTFKRYLKEEGKTKNMETHVLPQRNIFAIIGREGGEVLEVIEDGWLGSRLYISNTFVVRKK